MAQSGIVWTKPPSALNPAIVMYGNKVRAAVVMVESKIGANMETYAKDNVPWTDRTAHARQGLFYAVDSEREIKLSESPEWKELLPTQEQAAISVAKDVVALYLSHSMTYGKWLELCNAGKYSVIMRTMEAHYGELMQMLKAIFK